MKTFQSPISHGYIALVSAIIISIVLGLLAFTLSTREWFVRDSALGSEYKAESRQLAESCAQTALLRIAQNDTYSPSPGGEIIPVGSLECVIESVTYATPDVIGRKLATITTKGVYKNSWSTLRDSVSVRSRSRSTITEAVLHISLRVINNDGGLMVPSDFTINVGPASLSPNPSTFTGSFLGTSVSLYAGGAPTITVTGPSGYIEHQEGCTGILPHGSDSFCNITEDDTPNIDILTSIASFPPTSPHQIPDINIVKSEWLQ